MKDLTKELYFSPSDSTTVKEVKSLFEQLLGLTWTIETYSGAKTFNLKDLGWRIEYHNKKRSAGSCTRKRNRKTGEVYDKRVQLSMHFLSQDVNLGEGKGAEWEEVIRHELAHAVDVEMRGTSDHGYKWKAVANKMLSSGRRTFSECELADEKLSKYTLVCENGCGKKRPSHRKKKGNSSCGDCSGGRFNPDFILTQVQNY